MGVGVEVQHIKAQLSLTDLNLLQRVTDALGSTTSASSCWSPIPRKNIAPVIALSAGGKVQSEIADVRVEGVTITLIDDIKASTPPILRASVVLVNTVATNWSSTMELHGEVQLAVANYNAQAAAWEPLLLGGADGDDVNKLVPFTAELAITVPQTEWVPPIKGNGHKKSLGDASPKSSADGVGHGIQVLYSNKSSKTPVASMVDGKPASYWDGGNKLTNYAVFDFGRTVKCMRMRYSAVNKSAYAPKSCELYVCLCLPLQCAVLFLRSTTTPLAF
jgi:hypothetical protein